MSAAHLFVADLEHPEVDAVDEHHIARVLRLRPGEEVSVADGAGGWRECRLGPGLVLEPVSEIDRAPGRTPRIRVGFALLKGDRTEWAVQKLTELGVDRITPMLTDRSVVRWEADKAARQAERLTRVAREAAMQSRQRWLPVVDALTPFRVLVAEAGVALAERGGGPPSLDHPTLLVGPEGGWSETEAAAVATHVGLGPAVLRAETAALVGGVVLCGFRAGFVASTRGARSN